MALTWEEFGHIEHMISPKRCLAGAVAKMLLASPDPKKRGRAPQPGSFLHSFPNMTSTHWTPTGLHGALILVADDAKGTCYIQMFSAEPFKLCFQYEVYYNFEFAKLGNGLYSFEVDDCIIGFVFSSQEEGIKFSQQVAQFTPHDRKGKKQTAAKDKRAPGFFNILGKIKPRAPVIGAPMGVHQHGHLSLKADGTFDVDAIPKEWRHTFKAAGIKKRDLQNPTLVKDILLAMEEEDIAQTYQAQDPKLQGLRTDDIINKYGLPEREQYRQYAMQEEEYRKQQEEYEQYQRQQEKLTKWEETHHATMQRKKAKDFGATLPPGLKKPPLERKGSKFDNYRSPLKTNTPLPPDPTKTSTNGKEAPPLPSRKKRVSDIAPLSDQSTVRTRPNRKPSNLTEYMVFGEPKKQNKGPRRDGRPRAKSPRPQGEENRGTRNGERNGERTKRPSRVDANGNRVPVRRKKPGGPRNHPGEGQRYTPRNREDQRNTPAGRQRNTEATGGQPRRRRDPNRKPTRTQRQPEADNRIVEIDLDDLPPPPPPPVASVRVPPPPPAVAPQLPKLQPKKKPAANRAPPGGLLAQIQAGTVQLNETGNWMQTTIKRVNDKVMKQAGPRDTLVNKLQQAVLNRRGDLGIDDDESDSDDSWDVDDD